MAAPTPAGYPPSSTLHPPKHPTRALCHAWLLLPILALGLTACDAVEPTDADQLVVEAFFAAGEDLPAVTLRRTRGIEGSAADDAATGAEVTVSLTPPGEAPLTVAYTASGTPGVYAPTDAAPPLLLAPGTRVALEAVWREQRATAETLVPPPIRLDRVELRVPDEPVEAVLLDSLRLDTLATGAREGFIYPVEVDVRWEVLGEGFGPDSLFYVRPNLQPATERVGGGTAIERFFVREDAVLRESDVPREGAYRSWTGLYAVPVDRADSPLPAHMLRVALLRSGADYARYAATGQRPDRREPASNVEGALGIAAAVAVDSARVAVPRGQ